MHPLPTHRRERSQPRAWRHWDPLISSPFCMWVSVTFTDVLSKVRNRHGSPWAQARTRVLERLCYPSHGTKTKSLGRALVGSARVTCPPRLRQLQSGLEGFVAN